jgi:RNAse (barnase) inhibitor barstar
MPDLPSAYSTLIRAFDLPDYFGRNLDALRDCVTDADILGGSAFVICFDNPALALKRANSDALAGLLETFAAAAEELGQPVQEAASWDRSAIPFHIVLRPDNDDPRLQSYPIWQVLADYPAK